MDDELMHITNEQNEQRMIKHVYELCTSDAFSSIPLPPPSLITHGISANVPFFSVSLSVFL